MTYRMPDPDILIKMFEDFDKMKKDDLVATLTLNCCIAGAIQISGVIPPKEYDRLSKKCANAVRHALARKEWKELYDD